MGDRYEDDELMDLFELLPVSAQQSVARGEVDLLYLLDRLTDSTQRELCPRCCEREVSTKYARFGLCDTCVRNAMVEGHRARVAELTAQREDARNRKIVQRLRDEIDPDRPRRRNRRVSTAKADTGREWTTHSVDETGVVATYCDRCGDPFFPKHGETTCLSCVERAERREQSRSMSVAGDRRPE